jgi:GT2 family glycosyltransferase
MLELIMEISIIVLTFNAKEITLKMFSSLEKSVAFFENSSKKKCEVLLIDNASKDGVLEEINKVYTDSSFLKIVTNSENLGFSKGNNKALKESSKSSKYILFLNPDIILDEDAIYKVYEFMEENPKVGLSTCLVNLPSGEIDIDCHRAFPTIWNAFCYFSKLEAGLGKILPQLFGRYHMLW